MGSRVMRRLTALLRVAVIAASVPAPAAHAQIVISEIMAAPSQRILRWSDAGVASLGHGTAWYEASFCDSNWPSAVGPFGFGQLALTTDLRDEMLSRANSLYLRTQVPVSPQQAANASDYGLEIYFDDAFVAYLNGKELGRYNAGPEGLFMYRDHQTFNTHNPGTPVLIPIGTDGLEAGTNLLAIQALNRKSFDGDFRISARVVETPPPGTDLFPWTGPSFDDSGWRTANGPLGLDTATHYALGTNLVNEMRGATATLYARTSFTVSSSDASAASSLKVDIDYDDGFILFLNGKEVLRQKAGNPGDFVAFFGTADASRKASNDGGDGKSRWSTFTLGTASALLTPGENVLACMLLNVAADDSDLIFDCRLKSPADGGYLAVSGNSWRFFIGTQEPVSAIEGPRPLLTDDATWQYHVGLVEPSGGLYEPTLLAHTNAPAPDFSDWIELHNTGTTTVALGGWSLTDDSGRPDKWTFPATEIPPGGYRVVLADELVLTNVSTHYLHAGFKLDRQGEFLGLFDPELRAADVLGDPYPPQSALYSYGRDSTSNALGYFAVASPGAPNAGPALAPPPPVPTFSCEPGFYSTNISLRLSCPDPYAVVRFTMDGSDPTWANGTNAIAPISLTNATGISARAFREGYLPSAPITGTFLVKLIADHTNKPVVSLILDEPRALRTPMGTCAIVDGSGIPGADYKITDIRGDVVERTTSLEVRFPDARPSFRTPAGLRFAGSNFIRDFAKFTALTRSPWPNSHDQKPGLNLFFREEYCSSPLSVPLFHNGSDLDRFESLRLRAGHNDMNPYIKDEFVRRTIGEMGHPSCLGIFAALYVNGSYKGYYNMCERAREDFMRKWYGGNKEWDIYQPFDFAEGDSVAWNEMRSFMRNNDMSNYALYTQALTRVDASQYIDYLLPNIYAAMSDWPHNNFVTARERSETGKFRFFAWDAEASFGSSSVAQNTFSVRLDNNSSGIADIYSGLKHSPEFRLLFADRIQKHFFGAGAMTDDAMTARIEALETEVAGLVSNDGTWFRTWRDARRDIIFEDFREAGLWPATRAPAFSSAGGDVTNGFEVTITHTNGSGTIYYTQDGSDPRTPGGGISGSAYAGPIPIVESVAIRARVEKDGEWSPEVESVFTTPGTPELRITEVMYAPPEGNDAEFVEIMNVGDSTAHLYGMRLTGGISHDFPRGATLAPDAFYVLVRNGAAFRAKYPAVTFDGVYDGKLSNGGEILELRDAASNTVCRVRFGSDGAWPYTPRGYGFSLVASDIGPGARIQDGVPSKWRASSHAGGSPGERDPAPAVAPVLITEALTHTDPPLSDAVELWNSNAVPVDVGGWLLSDDHAYPRKFTIPGGTVIPAGGFHVVYEVAFAAGPPESSFRLDSTGEEIFLFSADGGTGLTGHAHGFAFPAAANAESFGRHVISTGQEHFPPQAARTLGNTNAPPRVGPIVISEIMYHPKNGAMEFIELHNITETAVALYDPKHREHRWRINGFGFVFPSNQVIAARGTALVVSGDPAVFIASNTVSEGVTVYGPAGGRLDNGGETITLFRPDQPQPLTPELPPPELTVDLVTYDDFAPWPECPTNGGISIERRSLSSYGNDPSNWQGGPADGSPGIAAAALPIYTVHTQPDANGFIEPANPADSEGGDVLVQIRAAQYFEVDTLSVDGTNVVPTNTVAFNSISANHDVSATFRPLLATNATPVWWLARHALTNGTWSQEALRDQDGDGMLTWHEWIAGTGPTNAMDVLRVSPATGRSATVFSWNTVTGRWYTVQTNAHAGNQWGQLAEVDGDGFMHSVTHRNDLVERRFYRVLVR